MVEIDDIVLMLEDFDDIVEFAVFAWLAWLSINFGKPIKLGGGLWHFGNRYPIRIQRYIKYFGGLCWFYKINFLLQGNK